MDLSARFYNLRSSRILIRNQTTKLHTSYHQKLKWHFPPPHPKPITSNIPCNTLGDNARPALVKGRPHDWRVLTRTGQWSKKELASLPLCARILPLSRPVLVIDKVHSSVGVRSFLCKAIIFIITTKTEKVCLDLTASPLLKLFPPFC